MPARRPRGFPPHRGETSHPIAVRLTPTELARLDRQPGATRGDKLRRLIQIGDIAVSDNFGVHEVAALTAALSAPLTPETQTATQTNEDPSDAL